MQPRIPDGVTAVITERRQAAPPAVQQDRAEAVQRLDGLGMIDASAGQVPPDVVVGYDVTIGGLTVPVPALGYEVVSGEGGPQVTVTFTVDAVTVGVAVQGDRPAVTARSFRPRVWQPAAVDPRHNIPGWAPEGEPEVQHG